MYADPAKECLLSSRLESLAGLKAGDSRGGGGWGSRGEEENDGQDLLKDLEKDIEKSDSRKRSRRRRGGREEGREHVEEGDVDCQKKGRWFGRGIDFGPFKSSFPSSSRDSNGHVGIPVFVEPAAGSLDINPTTIDAFDLDI